jgi:ligand-binding sensor domain-containing protein/signal transduction histidine kinase
MVQTRDGHLWAGTSEGLARFDGHGYEVFNEWNTPGLKGNTIVFLFEDSRQALWVGTDEGVAVIHSGAVSQLQIPDGPAPVRSACEDRTGAVWLYLVDGRLLRCRGTTLENVWLVSPQPSLCRVVLTDARGQVWVATDSQLLRVASALDATPFELLLQPFLTPGKQDLIVASRQGGFWQLAGGKVHRVPTTGPAQATVFAESYPWGEARITAAMEDSSGRLVVGTLDHQAYWFEADGTAQRINDLSHQTALSLCEDREGNLWVGTDGGGLDRVTRRRFNVAEPWRGYVVQSISPDPAGGLWFGFNGGGAVHWQGDSWREYGPDEGLGQVLRPGETNRPNFSAVLVDRQQRVWVGDRKLGLHQLVDGRFQPAGDPRLSRRNIAALFEDRAGAIWVGTDAGLARWDAGGWQWFTTQEGLTANQITALAEDGDGNLWIGTKRAGLNRRRDGAFTAVHQRDGLPSENITALLVDAAGDLWVGTGNGLGWRHEGRWHRFSRQDGLDSERISYLTEDDHDHLWIGSNQGLMRIPKQSLAQRARGRIATLACRVYDERDGLPHRECTQGSQPAAARLATGEIWFPTIRGLASIRPAQLLPNTNAPLVALESLTLDDREQLTNRLATAPLASLIVAAGVERLTLTYSSLNLAAPERARFSSWLEGHEASWNPPTERRTITYTKLPPGDYRFHLKASNEDGYWNPAGVVLPITVWPPFWQTWWFRTGVVAGLIGLIAGTVYLIATQKLQRQLATLRQQEALEKERARIARDLHDQLGASLTQVGLLGEMVGEDKNQPEEVAAHARQICQTARTTSDALDEIVWAANPSNDTLEGLVTYACKYAQDYFALAGLRYRLEVPAQLPVANLPPDLRHNVFLAFKESVNNVVKHAQATEVKIRLRLDAGRFILEVEDNGRGPAAAATKTGRNGLRNMRQRMEDVRGTFELAPGAERGSIVRLTAPLSRS